MKKYHVASGDGKGYYGVNYESYREATELLKISQYHDPQAHIIEEEYHFTNADRIRAMSDEELKYIARAVLKAEDCPMGDTECLDCVFHDLCLRGEYYYNNEEEWLKQPAEVE